jgi:hypothetical protein
MRAITFRISQVISQRQCDINAGTLQGQALSPKLPHSCDKPQRASRRHPVMSLMEPYDMRDGDAHAEIDQRHHCHLFRFGRRPVSIACHSVVGDQHCKSSSVHVNHEFQKVISRWNIGRKIHQRRSCHRSGSLVVCHGSDRIWTPGHLSISSDRPDSSHEANPVRPSVVDRLGNFHLS